MTHVLIFRERRFFNTLSKFLPTPSTPWQKKRIVLASSGHLTQETCMQHESHIADAGVGALPKLLAILAVVAGLCAIGAYVVYGSGMWNPPIAHSPY